MKDLYAAFPGRKSQIDLLNSFFGQVPISKTPDAFFVYGCHAVGKTCVVTSFLEACSSSVDFSLVNCVECYTTRLFLESIVSQLFKDSTSRSCSNVMMLVDYLKLFHQNSDKQKHLVIVLDNCEYLDNLGEDYLKGMSKLRELTSIPSLSVIFITHLLPEKFISNISLAVPIYFPQYTKDELIKILMMTKPENHSDQFYMNYLNAALSIFFSVTRDLNEISLLVQSNFTKYCDPLEKTPTAKDNSILLWKNVVPHLKASLHSAMSGIATLTDKPSVDSQGNAVESNTLTTLDLPYFSKYFLISSYLASYNSAKYDKRLFLKNHGKRRKRKTDAKAVAKESASLQLLGPRTFPLDRLLAIFYFIVEDHPNLTASLLSQISTLVELRLLLKSGDGILDKPTYKCLANFSCVNSVARTVGFDLGKYLLA